MDLVEKRHKLIAKRILAIKVGDFALAELLWGKIAVLDKRIREGK